MNLRSDSIFHSLIFLSLIVLFSSLILYLFRAYGYDDPFITFRYAWNLRHGNGFVYNPGEAVLSTTAPGYALLLAGLSLLYNNIPLLGNVLSVTGLALGGLALYIWSRRMQQAWVGCFFALLLLTFPLLINTLGSEMGLYIGLVLAGFYVYSSERSVLAMLILAMATMIRPDGLLPTALVLAHYIITHRRIPWKLGLTYFASLLPWLIYGTWFFGSPIPATLMAKQSQGRMAIGESFVWGGWKLFKGYIGYPLYWAYIPLSLTGLYRIIRKNSVWLLVVVWMICHTAAYVLLGVTRYFWYYAPIVPGIILCAAVGLDWFREKVFQMAWPYVVRYIIVGLVVFSMLGAHIQGLINRLNHPDIRLPVYRAVGQWIDANLPADASIGMLEVGIIGYYAQRHIVDFAGLLQPDVARQMRRETTFQDTAFYAMQRYHPNYLLLHRGVFPQLQDHAEQNCMTLKTFSDVRYNYELILYECEHFE